ncbi:hypothetical protein [Aneurinibacillus aneurinilyticus]|uniref:Uncharacterized protein n=1 Tax=Aneurinibacillus aneurinilyticus TaxID=1391 RepID=A0A848CXI1_ANEAE|nr:hypothetical protein [Aneurinibacillus aneurinilyticus]NME98116.1 hypothetical protein [Aneurinibacillus aneurinilyticus]
MEAGTVANRKGLEYEWDGTIYEKEVEWICLAQEGEGELLLNGYIPCNFSYTLRGTEESSRRLQVYECVNPLRNPALSYRYIVKGATIQMSIFILDLPTLLHFFYYSSEKALHDYAQSVV